MTGRLIDADKLKDWLYNMPYYNDSINDRTYIRDHIDQMPTVQAIPVKWIKNYIGKSNDTEAYAVAYMLSDWEEEDGQTD